MAKKKADVNKSLEIRNFMESNPKAKPREVVAALKDRGIDVSAQFVSTVKSNSMKTGAAPKRRGRPAGSTKRAAVAAKPAASRKSAGSVSVDSLLKVKRVVKELGSIEETKAALATLEQLAD